MNPIRIVRNHPPGSLLAAIALVSLWIAGCQPEGGRQLSGKWKLDAAQSLAERMNQGGQGDGDEMPGESDRSDSVADGAGSGPEVTVSFLANGRLETVTRTGIIDSTKSGTWRLISYDGTNMTAVVECTLNQQVTEHEIGWLDKDSIKMTPPNMAGLTMKLVFRRVD